MGEIEPDDNPYLPPQFPESYINDVTANASSLVPSGFSFKFVLFAVACNLMFSSAAELFGSGGARVAFAAESFVFFGTPVLNFGLVFVGLFAIGCVKLGRKSLDLGRALKHLFLTTFLCYVVTMIIYFCRGGQFLI